MLKITLRLQNLYSYLLSTANIGSFSQGEPHLIDVNHCVLTILTWRSHVALQPGWVPKPSPAPSAVWTENLLIVITMPSPARLLSLISGTISSKWNYLIRQWKIKMKTKAETILTLESLEKNHDFMILSISSRTWNVLVNIDTNLVFWRTLNLLCSSPNLV